MGLDDHSELLRSLHVPGRPLVLPNAWDLASARAVVDAGFPVVATTSAGVALALGRDDHEAAPAEEMLAVAGRIARGVPVPVTVDFEAGYGMSPEDVAAALHDVGAAGCNLEDTEHPAERLREPSAHAGWLRRVRSAADARGYPLVINARVDTFLLEAGGGEQLDHVESAVERARAYLDAGVDCVYPIALYEPEAIERFVGAVGGPVNVLASPQAPSIAKLAAAGVARISFGGLIYRGAMQALAETLAEIRAEADRLPTQ